MLSILAALALQAPAPESTWVETRFHRIHLANGNFIDGQLVEESPRLVVLKMKAGTFGVRRDMIDRVEYVKMRSLKEPTPAVVAAKSPKAGPRSKPIAVDAEKPTSKPADPAEPSTASSAAPFPADVRKPVDELLERYMGFEPGTRPDILLRQVPEMGADAVAYACWLVSHRNVGTPVKELVEALGHHDHPAVLPMLKAVVERGSMDERVAAVIPLEAKNTPEAMALLYALIGDPSARVWQPATEAVVRIAKTGSPREVTEHLMALMEKAQEKSSYASAIAQVGAPEGRRILLELSREDDEASIRAALQGLAVFADEEDGEIGRRLLLDPSNSLKKAACAFLGSIKYKAAAPDLIDLLSSTDTSVVRDAHWALQKVTGQRYGPDPDHWKRWLENSGLLKDPSK